MSVSDSTSLAGQPSFPSTCWQDLCRASDTRAAGFQEALNGLCSTYWGSVYGYVRRAWRKSVEDAQDLTQEFFATIFDAEFLARANPDRGSFRAFVLTSLRNFLANEEKAKRRVKRGGGKAPISLDALEARASAMAPGETPDEYFDRAWSQGVLDRAVELLKSRLAAQGRSETFEAFRQYCLEPGAETSYKQIAESMSKTAKDVDNMIYAARREFRAAVVDAVRDYVVDPDAVAEELERLFGEDPVSFGEAAYRRLSELARLSPREALGEIALSEGLVTVEQLDACLREQREAPEPRPALGEILVRRGHVSSEKLRQLLERQSEEAGLHDPLWRYEVRSLIARGGMASVFRAWDRRLRREVALKAVRSELADHPEIARRILHEARAVANLHHPNIVAIHDVCERGGAICLVMDLIDGRTLDKAFAGPPGRRPDPCEILARTADAVHYAHTQDVIHRDLKPANVMVDSAGEPHILDFGLARATGIDSVQTRAGSVIGTPPYMAPEQVRGDSEAVGPRTDVYSLGAILYEALTGKPPHGGQSIEEVAHSVLHRTPASPRALDPAIPAPLEAVAMKALNKVPSDRYATAAEFAEDLRRCGRGEPVRAGPSRGRAARFGAFGVARS